MPQERGSWAVFSELMPQERGSWAVFSELMPQERGCLAVFSEQNDWLFVKLCYSEVPPIVSTEICCSVHLFPVCLN